MTWGVGMPPSSNRNWFTATWIAVGRWLRATGLQYAAFALSFFLIAVASDKNHRALVYVGIGLLFVTGLVLERRVAKVRRAEPFDHIVPARLIVSTLITLLAVVAVKFAPTAVSFTAVGLGIVSLAAWVSEWRQWNFLERIRGPVLFGIAFLVASYALIFVDPGGKFFAWLLLAVVITAIATELHTEDWLKRDKTWPPSWPSLITLLVGAGVMAVAGGLMVAEGSAPGVARNVIIVVFVVVLMIAADNSSLVLVLLIAVALVWANSVNPAGGYDKLAPKKNEAFFLVLGDSYISGEGAQTYYEGTNTTKRNADGTNECRRAPTAWPVRLANDPRSTVPHRLVFLACSGALAAQIRAQPLLDEKTHKQRGSAELALYKAWQQAHGGEKPRFVLLSVGGNDAGFGTIGESCVGPGNCAELGDKFLNRVRELEQELDVTYADVREAVGADVPVVVAPYPIPVTDEGDCSPKVFLSTTERRFIAGFVKELDRVVESAATRAGFSYMDSEILALEKQDLCAKGSTSGLNFLGWNSKSGSLWQSLSPKNWLHNSLHPNESGHTAIYRAARQWFKDHRALRAGTPTVDPPRAVPDMEQLVGFGSTALCRPEAAKKCTIAGGGWVLDQTRQLLRVNFLIVLLAAIGAWMLAVVVIRGWRALPGISAMHVPAAVPPPPQTHRRRESRC